MRFDRSESPAHVNEGDGWTEATAAQWLAAHDLHADDLNFEGGYIRAKQYDTGRQLGGDHIETGILLMKAEKRED